MTATARLTPEERHHLRTLLAEASVRRTKAPPTTETPLRRVERALYLSRRGTPLRQAVKEAGTTISKVRQMVPGVVKTGAGWSVPFDDNLPRTIEILTAGGRTRTYTVTLREAEKYSLYLQSLKEAKMDPENARAVLGALRLRTGRYLTTTDGRKIVLVFDPRRLFDNLRVAEAPGWTGDLGPEPYEEEGP